MTSTAEQSHGEVKHLLDVFIACHATPSLERSPLSEAGRYQLIFAAKECKNYLAGDKDLSYSDIYELLSNLLLLHKKLFSISPEAAADYANMLAAFVSIIKLIPEPLTSASTSTTRICWPTLRDKLLVAGSGWRGDSVVPVEYIPRMADFSKRHIIGTGGFGVVYRVVYKPVMVPCALKLVKQKHFQSKNEWRFVDSLVASMIKSPFHVRTYACYATQNEFLLLMRYIGGPSVHMLLEKYGCLLLDDIRLITAQLLLAVEHMHRRGFIHRDIKPSNVMVMGNGRALLIDYETAKPCMGHYGKNGMSLFARRMANEFDDRELAGTLYFMAPEVLQKKEYGRASDFWGIGVTLFKMFTGAHPYRSGLDPSTTHTHIKPTAEAGTERMAARISLMQTEAKELLLQLLNTDPVKRIALFTYSEMKQHAFFTAVDWEQLSSRIALFHSPLIDQAVAEIELFDGPRLKTKQTKVPTAFEDLRDIEQSQQHKALFTYVSPKLIKLLDKIRAGKSSAENIVEFAKHETSCSRLIDDQKRVDALEILTSFMDETMQLVIRRETGKMAWFTGFDAVMFRNFNGLRYLIVTSVQDNSPASLAGVVYGDVILAIDDQSPINGQLNAVKILKPTLTLTVLAYNPYRMIATCSAASISNFFQSSRKVSVKLERCSDTLQNTAAFGFELKEFALWDNTTKSFTHVYLVSSTADSNMNTQSADERLLFGDAVVAINNKDLSLLSYHQTDEMCLSNEISLDVLLTSALRPKTS